MGIRARSWRRGRACEAIVEPPNGVGLLYVCGKFTKRRDARCDEHRPAPREKPQRRAS